MLYSVVMPHFLFQGMNVCTAYAPDFTQVAAVKTEAQTANNPSSLPATHVPFEQAMSRYLSCAAEVDSSEEGLLSVYMALDAAEDGGGANRVSDHALQFMILSCISHSARCACPHAGARTSMYNSMACNGAHNTYLNSG